MPAMSSLTIVSKSTVSPDTKSSVSPLKLSVSDLPMLTCQYIQKGVLFTKPPFPIESFIPHLKLSLSKTLSFFPPLAGRFITDSDGFVHIACIDSEVEVIHANATHLTLRDILSPTHVPDCVKEFFAYDGTVSYEGHYKPLLAIQVTELADGVFIGCIVNHAVMDGTSLWNFFNSFAEICRGAKKISKQPDFTRNFFNDSPAVLRFGNETPTVSFDVNAPLAERIFHFTREAIVSLKSRANSGYKKRSEAPNSVELLGKESNDSWLMKEKESGNGNGNGNGNGGRRITSWLKKAVSINQEATVEVKNQNPRDEISSFQALSAQLWRSVTRARKLPSTKPTTFRMAVNCRHRIEPKIDPLYFGNAIQSIPTVAASGEVLSRDLHWSAELLHRNVLAHDDAKVRAGVEDFEKNPRVFPLGNFDGASITMGSSPRFPMYDNDFGWGRPIAVRSGKANKFDGKISAFPGKDGGGSVDLEVVLAPETLSGLENDTEFMQYVSV